MKTVKVNGIVISENSSADFDKMLTILTPNLGKISVSAKGARKPKSLLMAGTQFLCFGEYLLYKGQDFYTINSCETIEMFYNIRTDLDKLQYASYLTKIISDVTEENQNTYNTLKLFLNTLYTISESDKDMDLVVSVFKMRLLKILGYTPNVNECVNCKTKENLCYFSVKNNGFKCKECGKLDKGAIQIKETTKNSIIYSIKADSKRIFSFTIPEDCKKELEIVSKIYFDQKLEKEYKMEKLF